MYLCLCLYALHSAVGDKCFCFVSAARKQERGHKGQEIKTRSVGEGNENLTASRQKRLRVLSQHSFIFRHMVFDLLLDSSGEAEVKLKSQPCFFSWVFSEM